MTRKYYAYFWLKDDPNDYVMLFRIKGSLQWDSKHRCFEDKDYYVRSIDDMVCYAALDSHPLNSKRYGGAFLISHLTFKEYRSRGIARFEPRRPIIEWD